MLWITFLGSGLEKNQKWSGCVLDESIVEYYRNHRRIGESHDKMTMIESDNSLLVRYDNVPINGTLKSAYVVNWTGNQTEQDIINSFAAHEKRKNENPEVKVKTEMKIQNTIDFLNYCKSIN